MASQTCPAFIRITFMTDRPVALVTGAARRLGREISLALASQGWAVAVHYATSVSYTHLTLPTTPYV